MYFIMSPEPLGTDWEPELFIRAPGSPMMTEEGVIPVKHIREKLPNRRQCESFELNHAGLDFTICIGSYPDGRLAEIFISSNKPGSPIEAIARDAAVTASIALQFGADVETIRAALTRDHDGGPATAFGAALDTIARDARARTPKKWHWYRDEETAFLKGE